MSQTIIADRREQIISVLSNSLTPKAKLDVQSINGSFDYLFKVSYRDKHGRYRAREGVVWESDDVARIANQLKESL